jgi:4-hydroxy-4-methyl-2-oxoglutarate aldolase
MITDPPLLTVRRKFPRPDPSLLKAYAGIPTSLVVDAMGGRGALDHRIKPLIPPNSSLAGPALTCSAGPGDNLALFGAFEAAQPGDIVIAATDGFTTSSVIGDLMAGLARNCGVAGVVTDGLARDLPGILAANLPVYCAGLSPNSAVRFGPGTVGFPVIVGGVRAEAGDIVICDQDGAVIVPLAQAVDIAVRLGDTGRAETEFAAAISAGLKVPDFYQKLLLSGRIAEVL